MADDLAKEIASSALGIGWLDTESAARKVAKHSAERIEELEAKLAKAVDVLGYYARNDDGGSIARTALEQLTGGKDE